MSSSLKENNFFLLLGAGASKSAGVPLAKDFLGYFRKDLIRRNNNLDINRLIATLDDITNEWRARNSQKDINLEIFYEYLNHINRAQDFILPSEQNKYFIQKNTETVFLEAELMGYIRERCLISKYEKAKYLMPLLDLLAIYPTLDIVTLNYDTAIETLCNSRNIYWTDGFNSKGNWDPSQYKTSTIHNKVRLYKLHGSVTWYQGPHVNARFKRIFESDFGAVGQKIGRASTPTIDALMIYPGVGKQLIFGPYIEMMAHFKRMAFIRELCISIGYSFGDPHIKRAIIDQFHLNSNLRLIVIDPNAKEIALNLAIDGGLPWRSQERIVPVSNKIEEILQNKHLLKHIKKWLRGDLGREEKRSISFAIKQFRLKHQNKQIKKIIGSPLDLWGMAIERKSNFAYITQLSAGKLFRLHLDSHKWELVIDNLKRAIGVAVEPSGDCLYVVEAEYQLNEDGLFASEKEKRFFRYVQKKEGFGRLWRISLVSEHFGIREPITYIGSKTSDPPFQPYHNIKSQRIWNNIRGALRWPEPIIIEKPKKSVLVAESHRLCRIDLATGTIKTAFHIPLCMNLVGIVFKNKNKTKAILLESGWWELERGLSYSTTGHGRLLIVSLINQKMRIASQGFSKARGLELMPSGRSVLVGQSHHYPYGSISEIDLSSGQTLRAWHGLDEPRAIAIIPGGSSALVTTRDGLYEIRL